MSTYLYTVIFGDGTDDCSTQPQNTCSETTQQSTGNDIDTENTKTSKTTDFLLVQHEIPSSSELLEARALLTAPKKHVPSGNYKIHNSQTHTITTDTLLSARKRLLPMTPVSPPSCSIIYKSVDTRIQTPCKISRSVNQRPEDTGDVSVQLFSLMLLYVFMGVVTTALIDFSQECISDYELDC